MIGKMFRHMAMRREEAEKARQLEERQREERQRAAEEGEWAKKLKKAQERRIDYYYRVNNWKSHPLFAEVLKCCCDEAQKISTTTDGPYVNRRGVRLDFTFTKDGFRIKRSYETKDRPGEYDDLHKSWMGSTTHTYREFGYELSPLASLSLVNAVYQAFAPKFPNLFFPSYPVHVYESKEDGWFIPYETIWEDSDETKRIYLWADYPFGRLGGQIGRRILGRNGYYNDYNYVDVRDIDVTTLGGEGSFYCTTKPDIDPRTITKID